MRIHNLTPFSTARLRELALRVAQDELEPYQRNNVTVHFVLLKARSTKARRARRIGYRQRARGKVPTGLVFNQAIIRIRRRHALKEPAVAAQATALLLAHEFAEMAGGNHRTMRGPRYFYRGNWQEIYAWASELPLELARVVQKELS